MKVYRNFTQAYYDLVNTVYNFYDFECSPRGQKIRECLGMTFAIENPRDRLLYIPERKFSLQYAFAEILWYMLGDNSTEWISNYSSMWKNISDDGKTANSAYGSRIFKQNGYQVAAERFDGTCERVVDKNWNQWQFVKDELRRDTDSRRAVIHIRLPQDSIEATKDVPCTLAFQFFIRDGKLNMIANMRSTDLIFGLGNDVPAFTFIQEMMAFELGFELGSYIHVSNSLHVYERHFEMCEKILQNEKNNSGIVFDPMPPIETKFPAEYLNFIQAEARKTSDSLELVRINNTITDVSLDNSLWRDWARVLLLHRANKLKSDLAREEIISTIENEQIKLLV